MTPRTRVDLARLGFAVGCGAQFNDVAAHLRNHILERAAAKLRPKRVGNHSLDQQIASPELLNTFTGYAQAALSTRLGSAVGFSFISTARRLANS